MNAEQLIKRYDELKSARAALETYWQELAYYCMPRKAYITRFKNIGDRFPTDIYDSTAIQSVNSLAAGMQAYLTNPQTRWAGFTLKNKKLLEIPGTREWLRDCEDQVFNIINQSNFYQENAESYRDLAVIGTHCLDVEEDVETVARFTAIPIEKIVFEEDHNGRVCAVYIEYEFNSEQAVDKFGSDVLSEKIREAAKKFDVSKKFKFLFCVRKREFYNPGKKDSKNMPIAAYWIERDAKSFVKEGGYHEFPFMIAKWAKSSGDVHGAGPSMDVLADVKMLNEMVYTNLIAAQKIADPPLDVPDEAFLKPLDFNPGGINLRNQGAVAAGEKINVIQSGANIPVALEVENIRRSMIQRAFFNDLFIVLQDQNQMTAEEVRARVAERMLLLGPTIGNLITDIIQPVMNRLFNIAARAGILAPPPRGLEGQEFIVVATSPLARAQKMVELSGFQMSMNIIAQFAQVEPTVLDKIKFDDSVDFIVEITGTNPKLIRDDVEVEEIRSQRAEQQAKTEQLAILQQGADIVEKASKSDKNLAEVGDKK